MPSAFTLFGELRIDTGAFEGSLLNAEKRLKGVDKELDKTIASSNKLGDTSATVARRYEKLSEGIAHQNARLREAASAYHNGVINAQKYATVLASVETQTRSLTSRIADAKARVQELNETGLTHFQQQISGAVSGPQSNDLFRRLSGFQKQQLSFQANDIITGLLSGQNLTQILAQQGGQIVQIFQQGAASATTMATATTAAAAAQVKFTTSAQAGAVAQAATATASQATAAAMTVAGVSVVGIGAAVAAILVTYFAMKKVGEDIRKIGEDRLKTEEAVVGALNQQYLAASKFKERLRDEAGERQFGRFLQTDNVFALKQTRDELLRLKGEALRETTNEINRRAAFNERFGFTGKAADDYLKAASETEAQKKVREQRENQISAIEARLGDLKVNTVEVYTGMLQRQVEAFKQGEQRAGDVAKKAKEFAEKVNQARREIKNLLLDAPGINNPFVRIFTEAEKAIDRVREATRGLGGDIQRNLIARIEKGALGQGFAQALDNRLTAIGLRSEAKEFTQGFRFQGNEKLTEQLDALRGNLVEKIVRYNGKDPVYGFARLGFVDQAQQALVDKRIIALTRGLDPASLNGSQRNLAAGAYSREAVRVENEQQEAKQWRDDVIKELRRINASENLVRIINEAPDSARVETRPRAANTQALYGN